MVQGNQPSPQRQRLVDFVTPLKVDVVFFETVDAQRVGIAIPSYGSAHPDTTKWPDHKLVHVEQMDGDTQLYRYWYAADRATQDSYNYEITTGERVVRTYIIPRADYPASFAAPAGGTPDPAFPAYGFVAESLVDAGKPLSGHYVAVQRVYTPINVYEYPYRNSIDGNVKVTRTLKPAGYELDDDLLKSVPGTVYEVAYGNEFHNVLVKTEEGVRAPTLDAFNYKLLEGEALERYYIIERGDYPTSYPIPDGGAADTAFPDYGFVSDSLIPIEGEIQGGLVRLVRRYGRKEVVRSPYDPRLERNITVTRTIVPIDETLTSLGLTSGNGITYELLEGNEFHQILVKTDTGLPGAAPATFPAELPDVFTTVASYPFPPKLTAIKFYYAFAATYETSYNAGEEPRSSRSEDSQIDYTLVPPKRGPYKAKQVRRVTDDTNLEATIGGLLATYPRLPETKRETILEAYAAHRVVSHYTTAAIREYVLPESYHTALSIDTTGAPPPDPTLTDESREFVPESIPATTGFTGDLWGNYLVDLDVRDTTGGLKEVVATVLVLNGIYT